MLSVRSGAKVPDAMNGGGAPPPLGSPVTSPSLAGSNERDDLTVRALRRTVVGFSVTRTGMTSPTRVTVPVVAVGATRATPVVVVATPMVAFWTGPRTLIPASSASTNATMLNRPPSPDESRREMSMDVSAFRRTRTKKRPSGVGLSGERVTGVDGLPGSGRFTPASKLTCDTTVAPESVWVKEFRRTVALTPNAPSATDTGRAAGSPAIRGVGLEGPAINWRSEAGKSA